MKRKAKRRDYLAMATKVADAAYNLQYGHAEDIKINLVLLHARIGILQKALEKGFVE